jgi:hypothetical protein
VEISHQQTFWFGILSSLVCYICPS